MYTQSITRSHRTAFILAIDQSGSMAEKLLFRGRQTTKAEAVAEVTNRLLFELIERARRSDEVRDYYDIAVLGYSGDGIVSLLNDPEPLVPVSRLAALPVDFAETVVERRMPDGEATFRKISMPAWIAPKAVGQTPRRKLCPTKHAGLSSRFTRACSASGIYSDYTCTHSSLI